jgi:hypothetical protein
MTHYEVRRTRTDRWIFLSGAPGRNRTADTRLFKALLYRLSYRGTPISVSHLDLKGNEEAADF